MVPMYQGYLYSIAFHLLFAFLIMITVLGIPYFFEQFNFNYQLVLIFFTNDPFLSMLIAFKAHSLNLISAVLWLVLKNNKK